MEQVSVDELHERTYAIIDRVAGGEVFEVALEGRPVAHLVPVGPPAASAGAVGDLPAVDVC